MIVGKVRDGQRGASTIPDHVFEPRKKASGIDLQRGTLNICVENLEASIKLLGQHHLQTDPDAPRGILNWWKVIILNEKLGKNGIKSFVVRHERSTAPYLEVMSSVNFRNDFNIVNDDIVFIELRLPNDT